jgi:N-acetylneuraminic acid mutarotase
MAVVSYEGRIYSIGGTASDEQASDQDNDRVYVYDPETDQWSVRAPLLVGTYVLTAHVVGDKIYAFAGYGPGGDDWFLRDVQVYDPALDRWELKTERPSRRYTFMSEVVSNRVVVLGGHGPVGNVKKADEWEPKTDVEVYDVAEDTWTTMAPAPDGISSAASCALDGKIYVFGGEFNNLTSVYDLARDEWTRGTAPPLAREGHSCVRVGDKFLLFGGTGANFRGTPVNLRGTILDRVEQYDPANDTWTTLDPMPSANHWFGAAALGNSVYLVGGENALGPSDSVLRLDFP